MKNQIKTFLLLTAFTALIMALGQAVGGRQGLYIAFALSLIINFSSYWFSGNIIRLLNGAKVVTEEDAPELYRLVTQLAERANLPRPKVAIVDDPSPNAFATGRNPKHGVVAVTTGLLNILNRDELAGVLSHELAHIKNRDILIGTVAASMASIIMMLANMAKLGLILGGRDDSDNNPIVLLAMLIVAPFAAILIQMAISRSREYLADSTGARIAGTPHGLANALSKLNAASKNLPLEHTSPTAAHLFIVNPLIGSKITKLFSTHPPIEERIALLQKEQI